MRPLYIFDLDGTLADIKHRRHHVQHCVDDEPNPPVIHTLRRLAGMSDIWIFSGRSDEVEFQTRLWLSTHVTGGRTKVSKLRMRKKGDYTQDHILKEQWLHEMSLEDRNRLVAVFDDRDRVVKMWRDNGVACFQVAKGDF